MKRQWGSRVVARAAQRVAIDTRALAAFRIGAGVVVLVDLLVRTPAIVAFYTESGVLPRSLHAELFPVLHPLSVHAVFGSATAQAVLFAAAGVGALALVVGYRTRLATALSVLLLLSLQFRNPLVLTAGDLTLSVLLCFGVFLPLGGRYSLDAVHSDARRGQVSNVRTAAPLLFLVVLVYGANAVTHLQSEAWSSGTAVETVFGVDSLTILGGSVLAGYPLVLAVFNWVWVGMLVAAPLLLLASGRSRSTLCSLFLGAHLGILLTLSIVTFPLVNCIGILLFVPSSAWDRLSGLGPGLLPESFEVRARELTDWLYRPDGPAVPDRYAVVVRTAGSVVAVAILVVITAWAVTSVAPSQVADGDDRSLSKHDSYVFTVFSPEPVRTDGWYVAPATLESGLVVDAYRLTSVGPKSVPDHGRNHAGPRWTTYLVAGQYRVHAAPDPVVEGFAGYLCTRATDHYASPVENVTIYFVEDDDTGTTRRQLTDSAC
jgi:hypothetical protein